MLLQKFHHIREASHDGHPQRGLIELIGCVYERGVTALTNAG